MASRAVARATMRPSLSSFQQDVAGCEGCRIGETGGIARPRRRAAHRSHRPEQAGRIDAGVARLRRRRIAGGVDPAVGSGDERGAPAIGFLPGRIAVEQARGVQRDRPARREADETHDDALPFQRLGRLDLDRRRRERARSSDAAEGDQRKAAEPRDRPIHGPGGRRPRRREAGPTHSGATGMHRLQSNTPVFGSNFVSTG